MSAALAQRGALAVAAATSYAAVTLAYVWLEVPGLGIGHLFYLPIALLALASGAVVGALAGVLATALYVVGVVLSPEIAATELLTASTLIRSLTYVTTGALIGTFASRNRGLVRRLSELAERDFLTGLLNTRAFEEELQRRCAGARRFSLLLGDLDGLKQTNDTRGHAEGNALLRRVAGALADTVRADDVVARVGGDEFALLAGLGASEEADALCRRLEAELAEQGIAMSFGWAIYPMDGGTALSLFRRADERLYSSKEARKSRETVMALLPRRSA